MPIAEDRDLRIAVEGIVTTTNLVTDSFVLNNGDVVKSVLTTSNPSNVKILAIADITYYVGSVANANAIPVGSGITVSEWQFIPPTNDWGLTNNNNVKTVAALRNISAGTQTILFRAYVRTITNSLTPQAAGA